MIEADQVHNIPGVSIENIGFVCVNGFEFESKEWRLITGEDMYCY